MRGSDLSQMTKTAHLPSPKQMGGCDGWPCESYRANAVQGHSYDTGSTQPRITLIKPMQPGTWVNDHK